MTERNLMYDVFNGKKTDRCAVTPHWWGLYKFQYGGLISGYDGEQKAWALRGGALAHYDMNFYEHFQPDMFHLTTGSHKSGCLYENEEYKELKAKLKEMSCKNDIDKFIDYIYEDEAEIDESGVFEHVRVISEKMGKTSFITLHEGNPVCRILDEYFGFEDGLIAMMEEPEMMAYFLYRLYDGLLPRMRALKAAGADAYAGSETYCTPDIISPDMYRNIIFPAQKHFYEAVKKEGLLPICYFLGDVRPLLDDINRLGLSGLMIEESKKGFCLDVTEIRKKLTEETVLFGNIDSVYILQNGTVSEVEEAVKKQLKAAEYGTFVVSNGCPVSFNTPEENIKAMIDTVKYGGRNNG